jgi:hypothetical protein
MSLNYIFIIKLLKISKNRLIYFLKTEIMINKYLLGKGEKYQFFIFMKIQEFQLEILKIILIR